MMRISLEVPHLPGWIPYERRQRLHDAVQAAGPHVRQVVIMFLDGSTTRLCEAVAKDAVSVRVLHQETVGELPERFRGMLPGTRFLRRLRRWRRAAK